MDGYKDQVVTVKEWLIAQILMYIPVVNIIMVFVWAFSGNEKESKSNYFKANLIILGVITIVQVIVLAGVVIFNIVR